MNIRHFLPKDSCFPRTCRVYSELLPSYILTRVEKLLKQHLDYTKTFSIKKLIKLCYVDWQSKSPDLTNCREDGFILLNEELIYKRKVVGSEDCFHVAVIKAIINIFILTED